MQVKSVKIGKKLERDLNVVNLVHWNLSTFYLNILFENVMESPDP